MNIKKIILIISMFSGIVSTSYAQNSFNNQSESQGRLRFAKIKMMEPFESSKNFDLDYIKVSNCGVDVTYYKHNIIFNDDTSSKKIELVKILKVNYDIRKGKNSQMRVYSKDTGEVYWEAISHHLSKKLSTKECQGAGDLRILKSDVRYAKMRYRERNIYYVLSLVKKDDGTIDMDESDIIIIDETGAIFRFTDIDDLVEEKIEKV